MDELQSVNLQKAATHLLICRQIGPTQNLHQLRKCLRKVIKMLWQTIADWNESEIFILKNLVSRLAPTDADKVLPKFHLSSLLFNIDYQSLVFIIKQQIQIYYYTHLPKNQCSKTELVFLKCQVNFRGRFHYFPLISILGCWSSLCGQDGTIYKDIGQISFLACVWTWLSYRIRLAR